MTQEYQTKQTSSMNGTTKKILQESQNNQKYSETVQKALQILKEQKKNG